MREDDLDDEIPEDDDPLCPTIAFTALEKQRWRREWRSALIIKVLGRTFPFPAIARRLEVLWAKCGTIQVSSLSFGFYVVRFTSQIDYELAMGGGPWMMGDFYITVRPWRGNFDPRTAEVASTMVWARFLGLPREFINKEAVERIAERIGRPIRVDRATQSGDRGKYARVSIEVDLTKPLLPKFKIEGITYYVEYEGLHRICSDCGKYGHMKAACPSLQKSNVPPPVVVQEERDTSPSSTYGEWMIAPVRGRGNRNRKEGPDKVDEKKQEPSNEATLSPSSGSCFAVLTEEEDGTMKEAASLHQVEEQRDKEQAEVIEMEAVTKDSAELGEKVDTQKRAPKLSGTPASQPKNVDQGTLEGIEGVNPKDSVRNMQFSTKNGHSVGHPRSNTLEPRVNGEKNKKLTPAKKIPATVDKVNQAGSAQPNNASKDGAGSRSPSVNR
ncbi:unnamed protein product [Linum tenue]|nr:unnamed protein product [Linum tenue]